MAGYSHEVAEIVRHRRLRQFHVDLSYDGGELDQTLAGLLQDLGGVRAGTGRHGHRHVPGGPALAGQHVAELPVQVGWRGGQSLEVPVDVDEASSAQALTTTWGVYVHLGPLGHLEDRRADGCLLLDCLGLEGDLDEPVSLLARHIVRLDP
jgi:hypothetical protein